MLMAVQIVTYLVAAASFAPSPAWVTQIVAKCGASHLDGAFMDQAL